jgi:hypothetical protein
MLKSIAFLSLLIFSASSYGSEKITGEILETCKIETSFELKAATQIFCSADLSVQDGAEIITNGHGLQIVAMGRVRFGSENGLGLIIRAQAKNAGKVFIYARTASGQLNIDNKATLLGGDVEIEYGSSFGYAQTVEPGRAAEVRTLVGGQALQL